jgi:hypothetical protein
MGGREGAGHPVGREGGREAGRGFEGRGGHEGHDMAGGRRELARDDPARRGGRFDERVRDGGREHEIARLHEHDFHVHDVRHFNEHEWGAWREGRWHHDFYNGRRGWWYDVDGVWYPYAAPVYPFPLVVAPLVVEEAVPIVAAPMVMAAPVVAVQPLPAMPHVAYHCASPSGFYPALPACDAGWVTIAAH